MKKALLTLMCIAAMIAAGTSIKAQEVTITLSPGWNWISCPLMDTLDFETALGSFTPMVGDIIKSQWGNAIYKANGHWRGRVSQFYPGHCYRYYSKRNVPATVTFYAQQPAQQVIVTTAEPTDITTVRAVVSSTVTIGEGNHVFVRGVCWGTEEMPTVDDNYTIGDAVAGSQSIALDGLTPNTTYYVRAYVVTDYGLAYGEELSFTTESGSGNGSLNGHDYVDLGLPSGLLWATCNVGADNLEDYGDYFAWGETEPKDTYNWSTYQYCMGSDNTLTKYCSNSYCGYNGFTDNLTILEPGDDAATVNWGNGWRMPTLEEYQELYNNTTRSWTQHGLLFTAANGNSLFLPAAGYRCDDELNLAGSYGYYWLSSLGPNGHHSAWCFYFYPNYWSMYDYIRIYGFSVRAVCEN